MRLILYVVFMLSGAAGLIYESIWSRYLGLFVGHSAYAQVIVLAIFLGGMSIGAMAVGQHSERLREPLLWYAGVELMVGLIGLSFHWVFLGLTQVAYGFVFPICTGPLGLTVAKWVIASALIVPQSVLLGTTFPFMSAGVLRRTAGQPGRVLALLYFANSIGAAIGVLVAGFVLLASLGLPGTICTAAGLNLVAALLAYAAGRYGRVPPHGHPEQVTPEVGDLVARDVSALHLAGLWRLLLGVSFATAVASFMYEIAWIRMLSLVLGSATHAFELMLSAFILGLALGALWIRQRADRWRNPLRTLGVVQSIMGGAALVTLPIYIISFAWMAAFLAAFDETEQGYMAFNLARYGICLAVMLPATFCAGITLPLITKTLVVSGRGERAIGWVYGINTLGSIAGVVLAGLLLLPWIGLKALLIVGASCDMAVGVLLLAYLARPVSSRIRIAGAASMATMLFVLLVAWGTTLDRMVLTSGVYRHGYLPAPGAREVLFYHDGRTATVSGIRVVDDGGRFLSTNGKVDASLTTDWFTEGTTSEKPQPLRRDASTQTLLALLPLAYVPEGRQVAVIGQGSGQTSHLLLANPRIAHFVTIEIEPEMIAGSRIFYPANRRVFDDARAMFAIDDARSYFAAQPQQYDLILSEPSNPWVSGVSSLFTTEFYARVAPMLSAQGIFAQWLQLYEFNDDLVLSVLAALHANFNAYQLFLLGRSDVLIIASNQPRLPPPDWQAVLDLPALAADLQHFIPLTVESFEATHLLGRPALAPLLDTWEQRNSDFYPLLDLGAEKARYLQTSAHGLVGLGAGRFDMVAPFFNQRAGFGSATAVPVLTHPRMQARALGAMLRAWRDRGEPVLGTDDEEIGAAVQRLWQWENALVARRPPVDWRLWLKDALMVEADLHSGTAGVVDETFYDEVHRYVEQHGPPAEVCAALLFLEGLGRWDFAVAARAADHLLQPAVDGTSWMPGDQLRDGAVVAKLLVGDAAGARQYFEALAKQSERQPQDLRVRLLEAYVTHPAKLPERPALSTPVTWTCNSTKDTKEPEG